MELGPEESKELTFLSQRTSSSDLSPVTNKNFPEEFDPV
jgi:hypothetical protein